MSFDFWQFGAVGLDVAAAAWGTPDGVLVRQRWRLDALLRAARTRSPLYRRRLGQGRLPPLEDIEPIGKKELMDRFDDWIGDPAVTLDALQRFAADPRRIGEACPGGHLLWTSSGSTGVPALFVQDKQAMAVYDALEAFRRPLLHSLSRWMTGPWWGGERFAFVGATEGHFASAVSVERMRRSLPGGAAVMRAFSFLQPMPALCERLQDWSPTVLATYPGTALSLALEAQAGRLSLELQELWTGGETLTPAARAEIERAFACRLADSYGASEFLALAAECDCGVLHLNSDWAILEPVDRHQRRVPDGEFGDTVLLTNLANHLQPILRYDLGDRVRLVPGTCACGSPLPRIEVQGREADLLELRDRHGRRVRLAALAIETVLEEQAGIFDFQVRQTSPDALALHVGARNAAPTSLARARTALDGFLAGQGLPHVGLTVDAATPAPSPSGKRRRVVPMRRSVTRRSAAAAATCKAPHGPG